MHIPEQTFKKLSLDAKIVTEQQFTQAKEEAKRTDRTIENVLVGKEEVPEGYLIELLADHFNVPVVDLRNVALTPEVLKAVPEKIVKEKEAVAFEINKKKGFSKLAMIDPGNLDTIEFFKSKLGTEIKPYMTTLSSMKFAYQQYELRISEDLTKLIDENIRQAEASGSLDLAKMAKEVHVASMISRFIENALALNASDIHFEPQTNDLLIRYRVEGIMREIIRIPKIIHPLIVARIKILANLQIDEHRKPQDGRFKHSQDNTDTDIHFEIIFHSMMQFFNY